MAKMIQIRRVPDERHRKLRRHAVTAYDAADLALAEALGARLLTRDRRFAAARCHCVRIKLG